MPGPSLVVLIGSGPGIGRATASHFAAHGFDRVCLLSRNAARLREDEDAVRKAAGSASVTSHAVDISDLKKLREVLKQVENEGRLECVHFNAARVEPSTVLETDVAVIEKDFQVRLLVCAGVCCAVRCCAVISKGQSEKLAWMWMQHSGRALNACLPTCYVVTLSKQGVEHTRRGERKLLREPLY